MLFVGVDDGLLPARRPRITDLKEIVLGHLGVARDGRRAEAAGVR
jgi:hypothetical protein